MKISQAEARRIKKRLEEIEKWVASKTWDWSSGRPFNSVSITASRPSSEVLAIVETARLLNHAVIAVPENGNMTYYAIRGNSKP